MSAKDENELFNPNDFESIQLRIYFKNLTLDRIVPDISRISLIEVGDAALTLSLPANVVASDNHCQVQIFWYDVDKDTEEEIFHATGKIIEFDDAGEGMMRAAIRLMQYDKPSWSDFLSIFNRRQEEISKFFEMGKK